MLLAAWPALPAAAQSGDAARNLAAACASCHPARDTGSGGLPVLNGLPREYLAQSFRDFRDGRRTGTIMPQLARGYDDRQIEALAAHLSGIKSK